MNVNNIMSQSEIETSIRSGCQARENLQQVLKRAKKLQLLLKARGNATDTKRGKTHESYYLFGCCFYSWLAEEKPCLLWLVRSQLTFSNKSGSSENTNKIIVDSHWNWLYRRVTITIWKIVCKRKMYKVLKDFTRNYVLFADLYRFFSTRENWKPSSNSGAWDWIKKNYWWRSSLCSVLYWLFLLRKNSKPGSDQSETRYGSLCFSVFRHQYGMILFQSYASLQREKNWSNLFSQSDMPMSIKTSF